MAKEIIKVALVGNPNVGKTSVFNQLTGLKQQVGNYPGITVDKKQGTCKLNNRTKARILDLPGTYSLNASSMDENVVIELLLNRKDPDFPDVVVVVSEVENLKRNLLLFTQIKDLEVPTLLVINMCDLMKAKGIEIDLEALEKELNTKVVLVSSRKKLGIDSLREAIADYKSLSLVPCLNASSIDEAYFNRLKQTFPNQSLYKLWLVITQDVNFLKLERKKIQSSFTKPEHELKQLQHKETIKRYQFINSTLKKSLTVDTSKATGLQARLDRILTHKIGGYLIFMVVLLMIFQFIFDWSEIPMSFIDDKFSMLSQYFKDVLPKGVINQLITEGVIPGLNGIAIFIRQIAFLFLFISVLEETGYMSRIVFIMDRIMKRFGLSGKSVIPLMSGAACAIPAIMSARNIENWKERLIIVLVTPFTTCSARLPVYIILISLIIPEKRILGLFSLKGLTLMGLYLIGFGTAILAAYLLDKTFKAKRRSYFVIEMPSYKLPLLKNVIITVIEKTKTFVVGAGKIIVALSIVLWFLKSNGPASTFGDAHQIVKEQFENIETPPNKEQYTKAVNAYKSEHSYIGYVGKFIEPVLRPLGYDWKISIAIISSFAAREVFVGTLATIYSVEEDDQLSLIDKMSMETHVDSGKKVFDFPTGVSLLLFYAFAMQCMSTLAVVKKETGTWRWALIQLFVMTGLAYLASFVAYQIFS